MFRMESAMEVYGRVPLMESRQTEDGVRRLHEHEEIMHGQLFWKGWPCFSDTVLASIVTAAKDSLEGFEKAPGTEDTEERDKHLMMIMLLFTSIRVDLNANLFIDERQLTKEDRENVELRWRDLGFPLGIRTKLRGALLKGENVTKSTNITDIIGSIKSTNGTNGINGINGSNGNRGTHFHEPGSESANAKSLDPVTPPV